MILKCKDNSKISLITDSMRGAGAGEGKSILGSLKEGQEVIIEDGIAKCQTAPVSQAAYAQRIAASAPFINWLVLPWKMQFA